MIRRILFIVALCCFSFQAHAARGFGSTYGLGATNDYVTSGYTTAPSTSMSYSIWANMHGAGTGGFGFLWAQQLSAGGTNQSLIFLGSTATMGFEAGWSAPVGGGTNANFQFTAPSLNVWHHYLITYDGSSTANAPKIYVDCASVSVTTQNAPGGTYGTASRAFAIGTQLNLNNNWGDGRMAEFAVWNGSILTPNDDLALCRGASPRDVHGGPSLYLPLLGINGEPDWGTTHGSQTVNNTKSQPHSPTQPYPQIVYGQ